MATRGIVSLAVLSLGLTQAGIVLADTDDAEESSADEGEGEDTESEASEPDESESDKEVPVDPIGVAGYKKGFYISDGGLNKVSFGGRIQGRFEFENSDLGEGVDRLNSHAFLVPRARFQMGGQTLSERISFKFTADFGKGQVSLKDYWFQYQLGKGEMRIRGGQYKKPFARQQINSSGRLQFVDRTIIDKHFENGRDVGLMLHNNYEKSPETEWALGVFNGTGDKGVFVPDIDPTTMEVVGGSFSNVPNKIRPAIVARVGHNANGIKGYSESDLEGGDLRYSIAAAVKTHLHFGAGNASTRAGVDFAVKQEGVAATGALYVDLQGPKIEDLSYAGIGAYTQVGYMLDKNYEPALRYAVIAEEGGNNRQEISAVLNWFKFEHGFKWQTDVSLLADDDGMAKTKDIRARSQVQLAF